MLKNTIKKKKKKTQQVLPVGLYDLLNKHNTIKCDFKMKKKTKQKTKQKQQQQQPKKKKPFT